MDDYGYLYDNIYGFKFTFYGTGVGKSKILSRNEVEKIPDECSNGDETPLFVKCKNCNEHMKFSEGWFQCKICGKRIKEKTLLIRLSKENQEFEDEEYEEIWE